MAIICCRSTSNSARAKEMCLTKNDVDYEDYRKFGADTTIKFGSANPHAEEKTKNPSSSGRSC